MRVSTAQAKVKQVFQKVFAGKLLDEKGILFPMKNSCRIGGKTGASVFSLYRSGNLN